MTPSPKWGVWAANGMPDAKANAVMERRTFFIFTSVPWA
jgi:hypothetical protein